MRQAVANLAIGAIGAVALAFLAGKFLPKSKTTRLLVLGERIGRVTATASPSVWLGKEGVAEMNLHPAGRTIFDGHRVNVITGGGFIEKGSTVRIIAVQGSRIVVEQTGTRIET